MTDAPPPMPELSGTRLRLRPLSVADAPGLHMAYGDAESMRYWDSPPSRGVVETEARISRFLAIDATCQAAWAVLSLGNDAFVGMVNYHARDPKNRSLVLGWILVPVARGRGYMTETVQVLLPHLYGALRTHRVEALIDQDNGASIRLAERLGFRREGLLRECFWNSGEPRSDWLYSLLRTEWNVRCP